MNVLLDPNVAYVLLVGGVIVAILALFTPGTGILEIGALFMLFLAGYSIFNLQINLWALAILVLGVVPLVLAMRKSKQWIFLLLATLALVVGSLFLFRGEGGSPAVNPILVAMVSLVTVGLLWLFGRKGLEAFRKPPSHNLETLPGQIGEAFSDIHKEGTVYVAGEAWTACSKTFVPAGSRVRVISREGLILTVEPIEEE